MQDEIDAVCAEGLAPVVRLAIAALDDGRQVFFGCAGECGPEPEASLFDYASCTKLFTTVAFMALVDRGLVATQDTLCSVLPDFCATGAVLTRHENPLAPGEMLCSCDEADLGRAVEAAGVTFRDVLAHHAGLVPWRPLHREAADASAARALVIASPGFACLPRTRVLYSDLGFMLLGFAIEQLTGMALADALAHLVTRPLALGSVVFNPAPALAECCAPTELCAWRARRIRGEVHDENAARLGGVAGHAGLFGSASDLARFGARFGALLSAESARAMCMLAAETGLVRRGLGLQLWSADAALSFASLSPDATYGHTGFTGVCMWVDERRGIAIALMTNELYNGRTHRRVAELRLRVLERVARHFAPLASTASTG